GSGAPQTGVAGISGAPGARPLFQAPDRGSVRARADTPRLRRAAQELERIEEAACDRAVVDLAFAGDADAEREPAHDDPPMDEVFVVVRFAGEFARRKAVDRQRGLARRRKAALAQGLTQGRELLLRRDGLLVFDRIDTHPDLLAVGLDHGHADQKIFLLVQIPEQAGPEPAFEYLDRGEFRRHVRLARQLDAEEIVAAVFAPFGLRARCGQRQQQWHRGRDSQYREDIAPGYG